MREIKFRGKRLDNGEWVYGAFVPDAIERTHGDMVTWGFIRRHNIESGRMESIEVDRKSVGQYTGLKDKNGVEIYEGDIVKQTFHKEIPIGYYTDGDFEEYDGYHLGAVVITSTKGTCIKNPFMKVNANGETEQNGISRQYKGVVSYRCEKIGNIHDDPELLKTKEGR